MNSQHHAERSPRQKEFFEADLCDRERFPISEHSSWGDGTWYMPAQRAGLTPGRCCYRWESMEASERLIDDIKLFVWSVHHENFRGRAAKNSGASTRSYAVGRFVKWMNHAGVERLSDLPAGFGFQYLAYLLDQPGAGKLKDVTIGRLINVPVHIFDQSSVLRAAGRDAIEFHPFNGRNPYSLARDYGEDVGTYPPVPDELFVRVATEVSVWIERNSCDISSMLARAARAKTSGDYNYEKWRAYGVNKELAGARFRATGVEWRSALGENVSGELAELLEDLRAACVIAVQAFTGVRINEVLGLEAEPRDERTEWPACLSVRPSLSGLMEVFYIRGKVTKGHDEHQEVEWVAGARPMGTDYLPPPAKAIIVLEEMFRPWRINGVSRLVLSRAVGPTGLPDTLPMRSCPYAVALKDQVRFISRQIYGPDPNFAERVGWWRVTTHQWRKSFAQFVVRSDERLLRAVSEHFKHVSLAMTSEGYVGNDLELLGLIDDEALNRVAEVTILAISGEIAIAGPLAEMIERQRERLAREVGEGTSDARIAALKDLLREDSVRSWSCGWGDCFFRPETARCHAEVLGTYTLRARKPNAETRRPEVCCECANLVVLPEHRPFWESRRVKNQLIVDSDLDLKSGGARLAKVRVEQANKILKRLDYALERINAKEAASN